MFHVGTVGVRRHRRYRLIENRQDFECGWLLSFIVETASGRVDEHT